MDVRFGIAQNKTRSMAGVRSLDNPGLLEREQTLSVCGRACLLVFGQAAPFGSVAASLPNIDK